MAPSYPQPRDSFAMTDDHPFGYKDAAALDAAERAPKFIVLRHHSRAPVDDHGVMHLGCPVTTTSQRLLPFLLDGAFKTLVDHIRSTILPKTVGTSAKLTTGTVRLNVRGMMILASEANWREVRKMAKWAEGTLEYWFAVQATDSKRRRSVLVGMAQRLRPWERARGWIAARGATVGKAASSLAQSQRSRNRSVGQSFDLRPRSREFAWCALCPTDIERIRRGEVAWWKFC